MKCKKDLEFSTSIIVKNTNVEGKSENDSGIQDKSQKCEILQIFYPIYKTPF